MSRRWFAVVAALWLAAVAAIAARLWGHAIDDFFITDRYAWNLVHGHGFVFNPGERVFGTTAPGLALLLAGLSLVTGLAVPEAGTLTTALAVWGLALLLLAEGADRGWAPEAVAAGSFVVAGPLLWLHAGSEAPLVLVCLLAAARASGRRPAAAGLAAGAAVWLRPDAGLGVALLGLELWRRRRRLPWAYGTAAAAVIGAGLAAAWLWFGQLLPATLAAKRAHAAWLPGVWPSGPRFWTSALAQLASFYHADTILFVAAGLAGHALLVRRGGRGARQLALYSLALIVAYPLLRVGCYSWYLLPTLVASYYGFALAAGWAARAVSSFFGRSPVVRLAAAVLLVAVLLPLAGGQAVSSWRMATGPRYSVRYDLYRAVGLWLREHTAPDDHAAFVEVGTIAYFSRRPMDDLLALVTPRSLPHLARGDIAGAFLARPPEVFIYYAPLAVLLDSIRDAPWFAEGYAEAARIADPRVPDPVILYRRRPEAALPPPDAGGAAGRTPTPPAAVNSTTATPTGGVGGAPAS